jgi:hypothetical protein
VTFQAAKHRIGFGAGDKHRAGQLPNIAVNFKAGLIVRLLGDLAVSLSHDSPRAILPQVVNGPQPIVKT